MSLAGSIASMTVAQADRRRQRHLDDDPVDRGSALSSRIAARRRWPRSPRRRARRAGRRCRPWRSRAGSARGRPSTARRGRRSRRRRPGGAAVARRGRRRRPRPTALPDLVGDRPALEESRAAGRRHPVSALDGAERLARLAAADGLVGRRREPLDVVDEQLRRAPSSRPRTSASPTDGRLIRTFAAAPRAAASPRSAATLRSLAALTLLRPASASAAATSSRHASTQASGTSRRASRGRAACAAVRAACSSSVSRGQLHRRGEGRVRRGVLVGEVEEAVRERAPGRGRPRRGGRRARRTAAGPRERRDHRHEAGSEDWPRPPRRCRRRGRARADASSSTKPARVRSRKRGGRPARA